MLKPSSVVGASKNFVIASNSASDVHALPSARPLVRTRSCALQSASGASMKCSSCGASVRSISARNQARCARVAGEVEHHRKPAHEQLADVVGERRAETRRVLPERGDVDDLVREEVREPVVLHEQDGAGIGDDPLRERGLAGGHLAAEEDEGTGRGHRSARPRRGRAGQECGRRGVSTTLRRRRGFQYAGGAQSRHGGVRAIARISPESPDPPASRAAPSTPASRGSSSPPGSSPGSPPAPP